MGTLYVVATPIGNLQDITFRAIETLKQADFVICEDTRVTQRLLDRYEIKKPTISFHQHSSVAKIDHIIAELKKGQNAVLVSDAGTPGISDPGNQLVAAAVKAEIGIIPIPGPSAVAAALSVAGFATDNFIFLGFIPHKKRRRTLLKEISQEKRTVVFFESRYRIEKAMEQLAEHIDPERQIVIGKELTKIHETILRGNIKEILKQLKDCEPKGEFVVVIQGK